MPAMEVQGTTGTGSSQTERSIEAYTVGVDCDRRQTTGGERGFALRLRCFVTLNVSAGHGRPNLVRKYRRRDGHVASCLDVPDGEDGVRDALRGLLRSTRPLQDLGLTDGEWESILPEDMVSWLARPWLRARHAAVEILLEVQRHVRYDAAQVLMTACMCKEVGDAADGGVAGGDDETECSVCLVPLRGSEAVELPGCAHAFHRGCISEWFRRKSTCPLCRDDVAKYLDPELQQHFADLDEID